MKKNKLVYGLFLKDLLKKLKAACEAKTVDSMGQIRAQAGFHIKSRL